MVKLFILLLTLIAGLAPPSVAGAAALERPCVDCHVSKGADVGAKSIHPPYQDGECDSCHRDHGDLERLVLVEEGNGLCRQCHETAGVTFVSSHSQIAGDAASCRGCHDPHNSTLPALLRTGLHRPVDEGKCRSCHRKDGRLLLPKVQLLCFMCHPSSGFTGLSLHKPVKEGRCLECHDPHGAAERALLRETYSEERWLSGGEKDYALCLSCHDPEPLRGTAGGTGFRRGGLNLHRLHILEQGTSPAESRSSGINCRNCHAPHASEDEHLMLRELDCGGVLCLKMSYKASLSGGECRSGCHGPQAYENTDQARESAVLSDNGGAAAAGDEVVPAAGDTSRECFACHDPTADSFRGKVVHLPVKMGDCGVCHLDHGPGNRLRLADGEAKLCAGCHDMSKPSVRDAHGGYPPGESRCSECHAVHSSDGEKLLKAFQHAPFEERDCTACHENPQQGWKVEGEIGRICLQCHDDVSDDRYDHAALERVDCITCHSPHASVHSGFLRRGTADLCFQCHPRAEFRRETVHEPVREGSCTACHPPHSGPVAGLLTGTYPLERFVPWQESAYSLCWECHEAKSYFNLSDVDTGFRLGRLNLHAVHIRDSRSSIGGDERVSPGVSCRNCHAPHSTDYPKLIRRELDCDGVPCLKLDYGKMGFNGTCSSGCHADKSYGP